MEDQKKKVDEASKKDRQAKRARLADQNYSQHQDDSWGNRWQKKNNRGSAQSVDSTLVPKPLAN